MFSPEKNPFVRVLERDMGEQAEVSIEWNLDFRVVGRFSNEKSCVGEAAP